MDQGSATMNSEGYPVLLLPRKSTSLETNCEDSDNVFIEVNIVSPDTEGNEMCIYTGFCNVKLIDSHDLNVCCNAKENGPSIPSDNELISMLFNEPGNQIADAYNQSQVWIDPARSPFVYNHCGTDKQEHYSIYNNTRTNPITVKPHNTYITQNVNNHNKEATYPATDEFEHKKFRDVQDSESSTQQTTTEENFNLYEEDEFDCGVFLSQLPIEILNEKENRVREERNIGSPSENGSLKQLMSSDIQSSTEQPSENGPLKQLMSLDIQSSTKHRIGSPRENEALKQLMSSDIQSSTKQRKTILYLGHDSHYGQTIQKIAMNDPFLVCSVKEEDNSQVVNEEASYSIPGEKKYQCDKCKRIFGQILEFRQHMVGDHASPRAYDGRTVGDITFLCKKCGKKLNSQNKFEQHCMRHGDPELECSKCHKVFSSKFTLRAHNKTHSRKYSCVHCSRTYSKMDSLRTHVAKAHGIFMCEHCDFKTNKRSDLREHQEEHHDECNLDTLSAVDAVAAAGSGRGEDVQRADSVIAKVMSNWIFAPKSKTRQYKKFNKVCDACLKTFDRIGDLKRHLIEHAVKSTLDKVPVGRHGTLNIQCQICQAGTFTTIDTYKAHLREHANVTIYKCTFCDKSFSDSSNFSKHKKIHGASCFQCDLCSRKFNSKRMLVQHIEYHDKIKPVTCQFCDKFFYFNSTLNKHIKNVHAKTVKNQFKCQYCCLYLKTLKEKWDHQWSIHNARKTIIDCVMCDIKFRKYTELKKHCSVMHDMEISPAYKLWPK